MSQLFEIKSWFNGRVLFSLECDSMKLCVEAAVSNGAVLRGAVLSGADLSGAVLRSAVLSGAVLRGAVLRGADLSGAVLSGAVLRSAVLSGAVLRGAVLRGADLRDAVLRGAVLRGAVFDIDPATDEQSIQNLDRVREIIMDNAERLEMGHWHGDKEWKNRTCAEETICGTTHCLAGWLQVCSTRPEIKDLEFAATAGILEAPVAAKMFYKDKQTAMDWLSSRKYVEELKKSA